MKRAFIILFAVCALLALPGAFAHAATIKAPPSANGLIGYWSFNEGTSTRAIDYSGNGNTGTLTNMDATTDWVPGKFGKALDFDGVNDYVISASSPAITGAGARTMSFWANNSNPTANTAFVGFGLSGVTSGWFYATVASGKYYFSGFFNDWDTGVTPTAGWHHHVLTYDGTTVRWYVDGVQLGSGSAKTLNTGSGAVNIGRRGALGDYFLQGSVDDVRLYNRTLTAAEITQLYGAGAVQRKVVSQNGLVGHWRFDEGTSTRANDSSGSGNTGTLLNMDSATDWVNGKLGKALDFDGTNDRVSLGAVTGIDGVSGLTISGWYYKPAGVATQGGIFSEQTSVTSWNAMQLFGTAAINLILSNGGTSYGSFVASSATQLDGWHHYMMVFDGTQTGNANRLKFYLDGVQRNLSFTGTVPATTATFSSTGYIGFDTQNSTYTNGIIDDVRIYNRALSAAEAVSVYGTSQTARRQISDSGLIGHWRFDEGTSTRAIDYSGRGNNGTLTNMDSATDWVTGAVGKALDFDGTNDYVEMGERPDAQFSHTDPWSISGWVYPTSNSGIQGIISYTPNAGGNFGWYLQYDNGTVVTRGLFFDYWVSGTIIRVRTQNNDVPLNQWTHIAMVKTGGTAVQSAYKLYVNGVDRTTVVGSGTPGASVIYTGMALRIGNKAATQHYQGRIDDMRLHNRALSDSEVKTLYNLGR